ncbi:hypothetical protein GLOIN_2v1785090 [Rhizophagus irregularis DAOM 181602=DAOM 197198]|nr:hypothetical protein GLOIN_2v1785090 [Rhizophagus irregularis DAOM 181602=DAOM 197198]
MSDNTHNRVQQDLLSADSSDHINFHNNSYFPFHISSSVHSSDLSSSNILRLGSLNVRFLVSPTKQLNLFPFLYPMFYMKFFNDRLIGLTLQLSGKCNVVLIGGYIPPVSNSNRSIIADCHSTLISWIHSARLLNHNVLLGGDFNAVYEHFLTQISANHPFELSIQNASRTTF